MKKELKPLPVVGEFYHFWDDGKSSTSRHYICKCERIITPEEAKNIKVTVPEWDYEKKENYFVEVSLYDHWHDNEMPNHDWLYETETDYFVECSCPCYDEYNLWFVRTKQGGWFSMDVQSWWQGGYLDVTGEKYNNIIQDIKDNPQWYDVENAIAAYESEQYERKE